MQLVLNDVIESCASAQATASHVTLWHLSLGGQERCLAHARRHKVGACSFPEPRLLHVPAADKHAPTAAHNAQRSHLACAWTSTRQRVHAHRHAGLCGVHPAD
eukprot:7327-Eustigmatos_ZCMA.PRE.1